MQGITSLKKKKGIGRLEGAEVKGSPRDHSTQGHAVRATIPASGTWCCHNPLKFWWLVASHWNTKSSHHGYPYHITTTCARIANWWNLPCVWNPRCKKGGSAFQSLQIEGRIGL